MKTHAITRFVASVSAVCSLAGTLTLVPDTSIASQRGGGGGGVGRFEERGFSSQPSIRAFEAPHEARSFSGINNFAGINSGHDATRAHIQDRFAHLSDRADGSFARGPRGRHDRIAKTRVFLFDLLDWGTPDWLVTSWADALSDDEILDGMPSDLVLDYWGDPVFVEEIVQSGRPGEIWTFRPRSDRTVKVTIFNHRVTDVRRVS